MTANGLSRRVDALEKTMYLRLVRHLAGECGIGVDELVAEAKLIEREAARLEAQGLTAHEVRSRIVARIADDAGIDAAELAADLERTTGGTGRWQVA